MEAYEIPLETPSKTQENTTHVQNPYRLHIESVHSWQHKCIHAKIQTSTHTHSIHRHTQRKKQRRSTRGFSWSWLLQGNLPNRKVGGKARVCRTMLRIIYLGCRGSMLWGVSAAGLNEAKKMHSHQDRHSSGVGWWHNRL